ncbi:MAG TPA: PQQ-binding-like beta-propeller repeat protein [Verrucomicrobiae bacterium]|nr:PQQ-binding-like beta-propeller repeat protein [Verrucomicrobiae bacterium]
MKVKARPVPIIVFLLCACSFAAAAAEWNQYRGPNHDGTSPEKILTQWPSTGLRAIWKVPMNSGFSAITVGDGKAFTQILGEVDGAEQEVCVALDANSGKEIWAKPLGVAKYDGGGNRGTPDNNGGDGPRSTPSYDDGRVYAYSSRMVLTSFEAASGKVLWSVNMIRDHGGRNITWESAASPLIEGNLVFVAGGGPGEALIAFDKKDGHVVWKGEDDRMTQSTPVAETILGVRQVIFYTQKGLVSVVPETGAVLWRYPFKYKTSAAISPVVCGDMVYVSAAYGVGASVCKIAKDGEKFTATELWFQPANVLNNHWSTPVCSDGFIYGIYGQAEFGKAPLKCVEMATGKVMWSHAGFGPGGCILVDGHLLVLSDAGDLVMVKATPTSYTETGRSHILSGKCWNCAGLSNGRLYARSTAQGVCIDLSPQQASR